MCSEQLTETISVLESFKKREGCRNFLNKPIPPQIITKISTKIHELLNRNNNNKWENDTENLRIMIVEEPSGISMYKNATNYVSLIGPIVCSRRLLMKAGYLLHHIVLYCVQIGLGTHWVGGKVYTSQITQSYKKINPNFDLSKEKVICMAPIGYAAEKPHFIEKVMNTLGRSRKRKPNNELFFEEKYKNELKINEKYKDCFENVRISPSAFNFQTWKIVKQGNKYHFFSHPTSSFYSNINTGICLASWHITTIEKGIKGRFVTEEKVEVDGLPKKAMYFMTWIDEE